MAQHVTVASGWHGTLMSHNYDMQPDLSPEDYAALLRDTIAADRFSVSPRIKRMRAILHKLEPPEPEPFRFPPLKQGRPSRS